MSVKIKFTVEITAATKREVSATFVELIDAAINISNDQATAQVLVMAPHHNPAKVKV